MSSYGASTVLSKYLDKNFFEKVLREYTKSANVSVEQLNLRMGCENGDNFCSIVYRVYIKYKIFDSKCEELTWIVKSMPYENERTVLKDMFLYKKERDVYFDILPKMENVIGLKIAPRCYYATSNPIDTIIFQDLKQLGFKQVCKADALDEQHCAVVLKRLGKFHAASLHLAEKNLLCFENYNTGLFNSKFFEPNQMRDFFMGTYDTVHNLTQRWPGYEGISKKMEVLRGHYLKTVAENYESKICLFKVLNHGDLWSNNIFFKYEEEELINPVECMFIDFQGCIYTSPGVDLNYFLNMSVQLAILQDKREYIVKEYYYKSLKETCHDLHVQNCPTFEDILNEMQCREMFGLFIAIGSGLLSADQDSSREISLENIVDMEMSNKLLTLVCSTDKFQTKMQYILRRADDLGLLG